MWTILLIVYLLAGVLIFAFNHLVGVFVTRRGWMHPIVFFFFVLFWGPVTIWGLIDVHWLMPVDGNQNNP
jgi:hypothetical protein